MRTIDRLLWRSSVVALYAMAWISLTGCENPIKSHHPEHSDAEGFIVLRDGVERAWTVGIEVEGRLLVDLGDTAWFEVRFVDDHGDVIDSARLEDDFALDITNRDDGIVEVLSAPNWMFSLVGLKAGSTAVEIGLLHLPAAHFDFHPREVPVVVQ